MAMRRGVPRSGTLLKSFAGDCPCLRALTTSAGGDTVAVPSRLPSGPRRLENLWRDFFSDPSQWWDHRSNKVNTKHPDFTHKKTPQALWLDNRRIPRWVTSELAAIAPGALHPYPFLWNRKLANCVNDGQDVKALEMFREMQRESILPDSFTFVQVLQACSNLQALEEGRRIHGLAAENGCELNVFVGSSLVKLYSRCGSPDEGRAVFDRMPIRNVVVWNSMIQGYVKCSQSAKALELSLLMKVELVEPDEVTFATVLSACTAVRAVEEGRRVHAQILKRCLESNAMLSTGLVAMYAKCGSMEEAQSEFDRLAVRNSFVWNAMIMGYVKCGEGETALERFHQMREEKVEPDTFSLVAALTACASLGSVEEGKGIHALVVDKGIEADVLVGNALVDMYSKCGNIEDATRVFNRMAFQNVVSWTAMLGGYAMHGKAEEALELFEQLCQDKREIDWTTFVCVLSACSNTGLVAKGLHYFQSMSATHSIVPRAEHYGCIVELLGRVGRLDEAEELINTMPGEPNANVWRALFGACKRHGNVNMGERVTRRMLRLDPQKASGYVTLSNVYAAANKWDDSGRARSVKQQLGRTWIVVDGKVHSFVSDDHTHPLIGGIHAKLETLSEKMKEAGYEPDSSIMQREVDQVETLSRLDHHSLKLAIAFGLISTPSATPLRIFRNGRVWGDCHTATKFISKIAGRAILVRDTHRFHHFKDGICSCRDYGQHSLLP